MGLPKSASALPKGLEDKISQCFIKTSKTSEVFAKLPFSN